MPGLAGGPRLPPFYPNYGFISVAAKPVESSWHGGEAERRNFRQRRSSLQSHLLKNDGFSSTVLHTQSVHILQYAFMLPLEVVGPGGSLSALLMPHFFSETQSESVLAGGNSNGSIQLQPNFLRLGDGWWRQRWSSFDFLCPRWILNYVILYSYWLLFFRINILPIRIKNS